MRSLFFSDWSWKLLSLFLAIAIWLTVHRILHESYPATPTVTGSSVTYGNLPVQVLSSMTNAQNFRVAPATVKVTVNGPAEVINKLQAGQVHALVELTNASGDETHPSVEVSAPFGVAVVNIDPPNVYVIFPTSEKIK